MFTFGDGDSGNPKDIDAERFDSTPNPIVESAGDKAVSAERESSRVSIHQVLSGVNGGKERPNVKGKRLDIPTLSVIVNNLFSEGSTILQNETHCRADNRHIWEQLIWQLETFFLDMLGNELIDQGQIEDFNRLKGQFPRWNPNLRSKNMSGFNLVGINFRQADLSSADLSGADMRDADLAHAFLGGADLRNANLKGVNFSMSHLDEQTKF